jgi:protein-L-isoaspartate(D-aspartate) O-methyltransferase
MTLRVPEDHRYTGRRRALIETMRSRGVRDLEVLELFDRVPRHLFLPEGVWARAYADEPVPIGYGQTASQPSLQAMYLEILRPTSDDTVLELGTGCGFLTALLSQLANRVYSVERIPELSARAREILDWLEIRNVALLVGDGTIGWRKYAPFDVIVVSAAAPEVPQALVDQLADGGRMLIPVGGRESQRLVLVEKHGFAVTQQPLEPVAFVPLLGKFGFSTEREEG